MVRTDVVRSRLDCGAHSHQPPLRHGQAQPWRNDHMVEHAHVHQRQRGFERLRQRLVCSAGFHAAAGWLCPAPRPQHASARHAAPPRGVHAGLRERARNSSPAPAGGAERLKTTRQTPRAPVRFKCSCTYCITSCGAPSTAADASVGEWRGAPAPARPTLQRLAGPRPFDASGVPSVGVEQPASPPKPLHRRCTSAVLRGRTRPVGSRARAHRAALRCSSTPCQRCPQNQRQQLRVSERRRGRVGEYAFHAARSAGWCINEAICRAVRGTMRRAICALATCQSIGFYNPGSLSALVMTLAPPRGWA